MVVVAANIVRNYTHSSLNLPKSACCTPGFQLQGLDGSRKLKKEKLNTAAIPARHAAVSAKYSACELFEPLPVCAADE